MCKTHRTIWALRTKFSTKITGGFQLTNLSAPLSLLLTPRLPCSWPHSVSVTVSLPNPTSQPKNNTITGLITEQWITHIHPDNLFSILIFIQQLREGKCRGHSVHALLFQTGKAVKSVMMRKWSESESLCPAQANIVSSFRMWDSWLCNNSNSTNSFFFYKQKN